MKIKKVEEKAMVIHTKRSPKLHRKEKISRAKKTEVSITDNREKAWKESSKSSIRMKNQRLKVVAETGLRCGAKQVEGGEEVAEAVDVMMTAAAPVVSVSSKAGSVYRKKRKEQKQAKKNREKNRHVQTNQEHTEKSVHKKRTKEKKETKGKEKEGKKSSPVKSRMIASFLDNLTKEENGGLVEATRQSARAATTILAQKIMVAVTPALLGLAGMVAMTGVIVVAVLAVIYNSPLAIFFPQPDTGYDSPRTVLCEYYKEFNQKIIKQEERGVTITYQNTKDGAPVSNFNDTLMVYMVKYGTGQAGYVMDEEGKKNLKKVFDQMNYLDSSSSAMQIPAGESLGDVTVSGYCACKICCGKYADGNATTASGKSAKANHTIAVDAYNPIVPMGTKIVMNETTYTVEDTGNLNAHGRDFDIYFASHEEALQWGVKTIEAFLAEGDENTVTVTTSGTVVHNLTYEDVIASGKLDEDAITLLKDMMDEDLWDSYYVGAGGQAVADLAMTKIGCRYSQDRRYEEGYYDCSSLVQRLYKEVGIELPATAAPQGKYCYENAMLVNYKDLKPGDLIFYSYEDNGSFRNISHVAIYVGNGKMVHAANPDRGVVLDPVSTGSVVFYGRPY